MSVGNGVWICTSATLVDIFKSISVFTISYLFAFHTKVHSFNFSLFSEIHTFDCASIVHKNEISSVFKTISRNMTWVIWFLYAVSYIFSARTITLISFVSIYIYSLMMDEQWTRPSFCIPLWWFGKFIKFTKYAYKWLTKAQDMFVGNSVEKFRFAIHDVAQCEVNWAATLTLNVNSKIVLFINIFLTSQSIIFPLVLSKNFPKWFHLLFSRCVFFSLSLLLRKQSKNILTSSLNN